MKKQLILATLLTIFCASYAMDDNWGENPLIERDHYNNGNDNKAIKYDNAINTHPIRFVLGFTTFTYITWKVYQWLNTDTCNQTSQETYL